MTLAGLIELALRGRAMAQKPIARREWRSQIAKGVLGAGGALVAHRKALYAHSERGEAAQLIAQKLKML